MRSSFSILCAGLLSLGLNGQNYTSYRTGAPGGVDPIAQGGICLMGGATEHDGAMQWFLDRASGGDVVVIRASGSDGYNDYMYSELGGINSVETIVFNDASAAYEPYVHQVLLDAEAIWLAGGDQWNYVSYWQDTPIDSIIRQAVNERNVAIGGTSAGMAVLGGIRFTAQNGTITSAQALANPYAANLTLSNTPFFAAPLMDGLITDSHYDDPDRRGRHFTFLARAMQEFGLSDVKGIACNEYTAVCIGPDGTSRVFGEYPAYDEFAYFLRANCALPNAPETCEAGVPLTWNRNGAAVQVYKVPGVMTGDHGMNIVGWDQATGGTWEHWSSQDGSFSTAIGQTWDCTSFVSEDPNDQVSVRFDGQGPSVIVNGCRPGDIIRLSDALGREVIVQRAATTTAHIDLPVFVGALQVQVVGPDGNRVGRLVVWP